MLARSEVSTSRDQIPWSGRCPPVLRGLAAVAEPAMIFDRLKAWRERREVFRELAREQRAERDAEFWSFGEMLQRAESAAATDHNATGRALCQAIIDKFHARALKSRELLKVLLDLRACDLAERLMLDGMSRYPKHPFYLKGYANSAELRGDYEAALPRWLAVIKCAPSVAEGYAHAAACLSHLSRLREAEAMLARGIRKDPFDVFCLIEHARIAEVMEHHEEALKRWQHLIDVPSDQSIYKQNGILGKAQCLRKMNRWDDAEALLLPFTVRYGIAEAPLLELALIAEGRGDWNETLRRYESLRTRIPMFHAGYRGTIKALEQLGRHDEADVIRYQFAERFPDDPGPLGDWARAAYRLSDAAEIARRWNTVRERFPHYEEGKRHGGEGAEASHDKECGSEHVGDDRG